MGKTYVIQTCSHASPDVDNNRFDWLGSFLFDIRPDVYVDLGDGADMSSLNSYDTRYPKAIVSQNYEKDIQAYLDAQDRLWHKFRYNKKRMPFRVGFEGNHEHRIKKAIAHDPRLEGSKYGISFSHLNVSHHFDEYHDYVNSAPALAVYDGICFGHYVGSGNNGNALSGKHHAYSLLEKLNCSVTVGHSHKFNYHVKHDSIPYPIHGLVAGNFKGKDEAWAGQSNREWRKGVAVKREVRNGDYDLQWISMKALEKRYGKK